MRFVDADGLSKYDTFDYLDLATHKVENLHLKNPTLRRSFRAFSNQTRAITDAAASNSTLTDKQLKRKIKRSETDTSIITITNNKLKKLVAHAGYISTSSHSLVQGFHNFEGHPSGNNLFPGITSTTASYPPDLEIPTYKTLHPDLGASNTKKEFLPPRDLGTYTVHDPKTFMAAIVNTYKDHGVKLNEHTHRLIRRHITKHPKIPVHSGIAGLHADVQALNHRLSHAQSGQRLLLTLFDTQIVVQKLTNPGKNEDFPACGNCTGIIPETVSILTGTLPFTRSRSLHERRTESHH